MNLPIKYQIVTEIAKYGIENVGYLGTFLIPNSKGKMLLVIVQQTRFWEKIKVTIGGEKPTWDDLLKLTKLFWGTEEGVFTIYYRGCIAAVYNNKLNNKKEEIFDSDSCFLGSFLKEDLNENI